MFNHEPSKETLYISKYDYLCPRLDYYKSMFKIIELRHVDFSEQ